MRTRYVQDPVTLELVERDSGTPREHHMIVGDSHYHNLKPENGVSIDSRTKHREFLKASGLTVTSDYNNEWKQAEKNRIAAKLGVDKTRRAAIEYNMHKLMHTRR